MKKKKEWKNKIRNKKNKKSKNGPGSIFSLEVLKANNHKTENKQQIFFLHFFFLNTTMTKRRYVRGKKEEKLS